MKRKNISYLFTILFILSIFSPFVGSNENNVVQSIDLSDEPPHTIGFPSQTFEVDLSKGWGLAYNEWDDELYAADFEDDLIKRYSVSESSLTYLDSIDLSAYGISNPRGLAFKWTYDANYLFIATSNEVFQPFIQQYAPEPRLWRIIINKQSGSITVESTLLQIFSLFYNNLQGLAYNGEYLFLNYDNSQDTDDDRRNQTGILVIEENELWDNAFLADYEYIPNSGRFIGAHAYGLACTTLDDADYLWATSGHSYIYVADQQTGRGIFSFDNHCAKNDNQD